MNDILKKRKRFSKDVNDVFKLITFKLSNTELMGSAGLLSQKNYSDYDLFEVSYRKKDDFEGVYKDFLKMINNIEKSDFVYFLDFKLGLDNNNRALHWSLDEIKQGFKDIQYITSLKRKYFIDALRDKSLIKLDISAFINKTFIEFSNIYDIHYNKKSFLPDVKNVILNIQLDMLDLLNEGQYMKYLKRLFVIAKIKHDYDTLYKLTKLFNSSYGLLYKLASQMKTIMTMIDIGYKLDDKYKIAIQTINKQLDHKYQINGQQPITKSLLSSYDRVMEVVNNQAKKYINI
jgi:hypothetical protein